MVEKQLTRERASSWSWILQAFTGVMLVVLLGLHMVVQHFVVEGGLRNYQQVVRVSFRILLCSCWKSRS